MKRVSTAVTSAALSGESITSRFSTSAYLPGPWACLLTSCCAFPKTTRSEGRVPVKSKVAKQVRQHILRQIERDQRELAALVPVIGWPERVRKTAEVFVPRIVGVADELLRHVEHSLNSPEFVRTIWNQVREVLTDPRVAGLFDFDVEELAASMNAALESENRLLAIITGDTVSKLIADFLCREYPDLAQNNRSTYPDLYFNTSDYTPLPKRTRKLAEGPALRGKKPTSIPDGVEVKSNRGQRIRVDCHHDHQGLHLALTFDHNGECWVAYDLYLAYLSKADYRRAERNTTATTDKFSFGHAPFISVITGQVEEGLLEEATD